MFEKRAAEYPKRNSAAAPRASKTAVGAEGGPEDGGGLINGGLRTSTRSRSNVMGTIGTGGEARGECGSDGQRRSRARRTRDGVQLRRSHERETPPDPNHGPQKAARFLEQWVFVGGSEWRCGSVQERTRIGRVTLS